MPGVGRHSARTGVPLTVQPYPDLGVLIEPLALLFWRVIPAVVIARHHDTHSTFLGPDPPWSGRRDISTARATQSCNVSLPGAGFPRGTIVTRMPPARIRCPSSRSFPYFAGPRYRQGCRAPGAARCGEDHPDAARADRRALARRPANRDAGAAQARRAGGGSPPGGAARGGPGRHRRLPDPSRDASRSRTRIEVVTEGVLTRMLLTTPPRAVRAGHLR